jgi:hypothetical protein
MQQGVARLGRNHRWDIGGRGQGGPARYDNAGGVMSAFLTYTDVLTLEAAIRVMERASEQVSALSDNQDESTAWDILATDLAGMLNQSQRPKE